MLVKFAISHCKILPENFECDINIMVTGTIDERLKKADELVENLRKIL